MTEEDRERIVRLETRVDNAEEDQRDTTVELRRLSGEMGEVRVGMATGFAEVGKGLATVTQRLDTGDRRTGIQNKILAGVLISALTAAIFTIAKHLGG